MNCCNAKLWVLFLSSVCAMTMSNAAMFTQTADKETAKVGTFSFTYDQIIALAVHAVTDEKGEYMNMGADLFAGLLKKGQGSEVAEGLVEKIFEREHCSAKGCALCICEALVENGKGYEVATKIARKAFELVRSDTQNKDDIWSEVVRLYALLLEQKQISDEKVRDVLEFFSKYKMYANTRVVRELQALLENK
jgi:hypothetical protein